MKDTIAKIMQWPPVAHAMAAFSRFGARLGPQFAGAITYFSVLSIVPILMFAFAILGMVLTVFMPELLEQVQTFITDSLSGGEGDMGESVAGVVEEALGNWRGIGIVAILSAGYSGSGWAGNLKKAVRMMWREDPVDEDRKVNPVLDILGNIGIFLGLLITLALGIGVAQAGSSASSLIVGWLGWENVPGIGFLMALAGIALTFVASWILMAFLFLVLPDRSEPASRKTWLVGVTIGAVAVTIIQQLAGLLIGIFAGNAAAAVFGPLIVMMLLMNLLATIIMIVSAWIGTDPGKERHEAATHATASAMAAARSGVALAFRDAAEEGPAMVRQDVAERGVRAGLGVGYATGAATGVGIGAVLTAIVAFIAGLLNRR